MFYKGHWSNCRKKGTENGLFEKIWDNWNIPFYDKEAAVRFTLTVCTLFLTRRTPVHGTFFRFCFHFNLFFLCESTFLVLLQNQQKHTIFRVVTVLVFFSKLVIRLKPFLFVVCSSPEPFGWSDHSSVGILARLPLFWPLFGHPPLNPQIQKYV